MNVFRAISMNVLRAVCIYKDVAFCVVTKKLVVLASYCAQTWAPEGFYQGALMDSSWLVGQR